MNIFVLDENPKIAANHIILRRHRYKMLSEAIQMLCNVFPIEFNRYTLTVSGLTNKSWSIIPYEQSHLHHPCNKWVAETMGNWIWTFEYAMQLHQNYVKVFNKDTITGYVLAWLCDNVDLVEQYVNDGSQTSFVQAFNKYPECKRDNPVRGYQHLYTRTKHYACTKQELHDDVLGRLAAEFSIDYQIFPILDKR